MVAQKGLFIKGEDLWTFMAVAKSEKEESKGGDLMRKLKPIFQSSAEHVPPSKLEAVSKLVGLFPAISV